VPSGPDASGDTGLDSTAPLEFHPIPPPGECRSPAPAHTLALLDNFNFWLNIATP